MSYIDQITVGSTTYDIQDSNAQRKATTGSGAPTSSIVGAVGDYYINTSAVVAPYLYMCTNVANGVYTWEAIDGMIPKTGGTMTGNLIIAHGNNPTFALKNVDMNNAAASLSSTETSSINFNDVNNNIVAYLNTGEDTAGTDGISIGARKSVSGSNVDNTFMMYVDKNGNKGVLVSDPSAWRTGIGAVSKSGDTVNGQLTVANDLEIKDSVLEHDVAAEVYAHPLRFIDKNDYEFGWLMAQTNSSGNELLSLTATREVEGTIHYNGLNIGHDVDGNAFVWFSDQNAWLSALGLTVTNPFGSISTFATAESGFSINSLSARKYGNIIQFGATVERTGSAITSEGNQSIFTIKSGYRPIIPTSVMANKSNFMYGSIITSGGVTVRVTSWAKNAEITFRAMYFI